MSEFVLGTTSEGFPVLEAELDREDPSYLVQLANENDVDLLWVHADADLTPFGFARANGYIRLHAEHVPAGEPLPTLPPSEYARVLDAAYRGLWGHKQVAPDAMPPSGGTVVGLPELGLCRVFEAQRLIDGPGVCAPSRAPESYVRLLLAGCAALGPGPADVETWGDDPSVIRAYEQLGFAVVERSHGWERQLRARPRSGRRPT